MKNQITQGEWVVKAVDYVDEANRQIWFRAGGTQAGRNPYFSHYFRVGFDGAGLTQFTDANGHHQVTWSPDREFYVDTWSRQDAPPVSMLRRTRDQSVVMELERADISALIAQEWTSPEPFVAKGHDGVTDIWGVIVRPSNFDPSRRYPVIEYIYATQSPQLLKDFQISANFQRGARLSVFRWHRQMMTLAELGFIVVQIEGMGSSGRSKAFQAVRWKNLKGDSYPDRIRWHQAVAEQYPYYDVDRVGVIGFSAGGRAAADGIIFFPEFYDVAVASSGGYDLRLGIMAWEQYLGWPVGPLYDENSVLDNAWRLQGKLLISVGETDLGTPHTLRFAAALIKAKDFDMAVVPVRGHSAPWRGMFFQRKAWDFFVRHLLGVEPPNRNAVGAGSCKSQQCQ